MRISADKDTGLMGGELVITLPFMFWLVPIRQKAEGLGEGEALP